MHRPERVKDWDAALARLAEPSWTSARATLVEADPFPGAPPFADAEAANLRVERVTPISPGETAIRASARAPAWLVVSEPAIPGWRTEVNSEATSHATVDGFFTGIPLRVGENNIELIYDPISQRLGIFISMLALAWIGWLTGKYSPRNS